MDVRRGSPRAHLARRIGKKAIFYGRVSAALGIAGEAPAQRARPSLIKRMAAFRPTKKQLIMAACVAVVLAAGTTGAVLYNNHRIAQEKAAAVAEAARVEKQNAAAQECYKKKTTEKSSMLGKITFDQLYDGDSCLAAQ